jgi:hypothetical protein
LRSRAYFPTGRRLLYLKNLRHPLGQETKHRLS